MKTIITILAALAVATPAAADRLTNYATCVSPLLEAAVVATATDPLTIAVLGPMVTAPFLEGVMRAEVAAQGVTADQYMDGLTADLVAGDLSNMPTAAPIDMDAVRACLENA